jgi:hypothetical protein
MKLERDSYNISTETLRFVLDALARNDTLISDDGDEMNNAEIITAIGMLEAEIEKQNQSTQWQRKM